MKNELIGFCLMIFGYARISTNDQNIISQIDVLKAAGCEKIFQDIASGSKSERPGLLSLLDILRKGDTLVICKLDRLGRSLRHLVDLVNTLINQQVDLISLNDPVDTSTPQGRLCFNLFAALAEFEREIIRERTRIGLDSARLRGRNGGRPKGLPKKAMPVACAAETLYKERKLTVDEIALQLSISKTTLYSYLRHRGVPIGSSTHPASL